VFILLFTVAPFVRTYAVHCRIDCDTTTDIETAIDACLVNETTYCSEYAEPVLQLLLSGQLVNASDGYAWADSDKDVVYVSDESAKTLGPSGFDRWVYVERCYVDFDTSLVVALTGTCTMSNKVYVPRVKEIEYRGDNDTTIVACNMEIVPERSAETSLAETSLAFVDVQFEGRGCVGGPLRLSNEPVELHMQNIVARGYNIGACESSMLYCCQGTYNTCLGYAFAYCFFGKMPCVQRLLELKKT